MCECLICGGDAIDISQDFCGDCIDAIFQQDHLHNLKPITKRHFIGVMRQLQAMADDFSEGSQQRWMLLMRKANELRDELWNLERKEEPNS